MKIIINELKRNINLDVVLQKNLLEELEEINTPTNILIRVENYEEGTVYYWSTETFHNRYDLMKELFNKFNDDDLDLQNLKKEDDPLWDEAKPILLGYAFYRLEPVSYLMANESQISVVSPNGDAVGQITVDIIPHDEDGEEYQEVPETPNELIGQTLYYTVAIKNLQNIAKNFKYNLHVEYQCFYDHSIIKTKVYNKFDENDGNEGKVLDNSQENDKVEIEINENFEHKIGYLTKEDIEFLVKDKVCFKVYSSERIEKKGKTAFEELFIARRDSVIREPEEEIKVIDGADSEIKEKNGYNTKKENDEPVDVMMNKRNDKIDKNKKGNKQQSEQERNAVNKNDKNSKNTKNKDKKDNCNIY